MSKAVIDMLSEAQELIRDPKKWCQSTYARDRRGQRVASGDPSACQWCSAGALEVAGRKRTSKTANRALSALGTAAKRLNNLAAVLVNDCRGHREVMEMFDLAIEIAKEERL